MKKLRFLSLILLCCSQIFAQATTRETLRGKVTDALGLPVENARVQIVPDAGAPIVCQNVEAGEFVCETDFQASFTLVIEADGFSILRRKFDRTQDFSAVQTFALSPAELSETVQVTANRTATRLGETPANVVTLSQAEIETTAAPTLDDALRQVAGFSLFRRTGSRYANPTAQGVSLRGVGASGASRSLVLFDGVPLNDSFGGWVQWNRVPIVAVERVEVLRGGAASLYGNNSLSGAINILPRRSERKFDFAAEIYGGTQNTFSGATFFGVRRGRWTADFTAAIFQTKGYVLVDEDARGAADTFAGSKNSNLSARVAKSFGERANLFIKAALFGEARTNGTAAQINRTNIRQFIAGGDWQSENPQSAIRSPQFDWRVYGGTQTYDQTFSAVSADRNTETLNRVQRVPAQNIGVSFNASAVVFENQTVAAGFEARETRGATDEIGITNNRAANTLGAGGRERNFGIYLQDFIRFNSRFILAASGRYDRWRNFAASNASRTIANNQTSVVRFPDRIESAFSPQISLLAQATDNLSFFTLWAKSFRAPTLNELYRGFRVGNVVTNANANLRAERAVNFESGASYNRKNFYLRGNFFWTRINQPISNVTLSVTPALIVRQRRNAGAIVARGLEIEAETRVRAFDFSVGYLLADSRVREFPANRSLENLLVPQTARHQFNFQTRYARRSWTFAVQGRASSKQFDDDLNLFRLEPYFQLDGFASRRFKENLQIFVGIENVFNSRYSIGRTPVRTVGSPINLRAGVRWN